MSVLTSDFGLEQGSEVVARVLAINALGESPYSALSSVNSDVGALV